MHYPQTNADALSYLSDLPYFDKPGDGLGQYMEAAMLAMQAYEGSQENEEGGANTNFARYDNATKFARGDRWR